MQLNIFQYYKQSALIGIIVICTIALTLVQKSVPIHFSIFSMIGLLLVFMDQYLWKYKPFSFCFWTKDFSGRYEGELEYEFRDEFGIIKKGKLKHVKTVHQTGSKISIHSFTKLDNGKQSSKSESLGVFIELMKDDKHYQFIYSYLNNGDSDSGFPPHYGTEIIKFIEKGNDKILSGKYFTERLPFQTKGKFIDLIKVGDNLEHDF